MFKQLKLYRIGPGWPTSVTQLATALAAERFTPCTATQQRSTGWVPPRAEHGLLVEAIGGQWIARMMIETKTVPGDAVREETDKRVAEQLRVTGRRPGKRELRDLRDDALNALLPSAFPRRAQVTMWVDPERGWLVLDNVSSSKADEVITSLVRCSGQGFAVRALQTQTAPQSAMSAWLAASYAEELPDAFHIGRECELKGAGDEPAVVKFNRHDLATDEVRQHIAEGKLPERLAIGWQGRAEFTLTSKLDLRKLQWAEEVIGEPGEKDEDRFDADVAIITGELQGLIADLIEALGGETSEGF